MIARHRVLVVGAVVASSALLMWAFSGWNQAGSTPSSASEKTTLSATADINGPSTAPATVSTPPVAAAGSPPPGIAQTSTTQPAPPNPPSVPAWPATTASSGGGQPAPAAPTTARTTAPATAPITSTPSATSIGQCADQTLDVLARTDAPAYAMGHTATFDLIVVSLDREPCVRDIGRGLRELIVTDLNGTRVWSSNDCSSTTGSDPQVLRPNQPMNFSLTWQGRTSHPHCSGPRQPLGPGIYQLSARLGTRTGGGTQFTLRR